MLRVFVRVVMAERVMERLVAGVRRVRMRMMVDMKEREMEW